MKTLIVYYSLEGNTDYAAKRIAEKTGFDLLRIETVKKYPTSGFRKFFHGGKSAVFEETPELVPYSIDLGAYDQIVIGFPVWAGNVAPPIRTFIKAHDLTKKSIAAFACQSGSGAEKAFEKLRKALGIASFKAEMVLIDPEKKPSAENDRKIETFCRQLT